MNSSSRDHDPVAGSAREGAGCNLRTDPALLARLLDAARNYKMTPAEVFEQRVSFVYGQISGAQSKEWVREHLASIQGVPASAAPSPWEGGQFSLHDPDPEDHHSALYLVLPSSLMVNISGDDREGVDIARGQWMVSVLNAALAADANRAPGLS